MMFDTESRLVTAVLEKKEKLPKGAIKKKKKKY